jgi:hypothetical protein
MPLALNLDNARGLAGSVPDVRAVREVDFPPGRGLFCYPFWKSFDIVGALRRTRFYRAARVQPLTPLPFGRCSMVVRRSVTLISAPE